MPQRRTCSRRLILTLTVALAVALAAPAGAFTVTALDASVSPPSYTGPCPTTFTFTGRITADGPGVVTYRWVHVPYVTGDRTVTFAGPGTQTVTYRLTMDREWPASEGHWLDLIVSSPNLVMNSPVSFALACRSPLPGKRQLDRPAPVSVTLKDGSPAVVVGDRLFLIQSGRQVPAPDGTYELNNGAKLVVKGGKIVQTTPPRKMMPRP